MAIAALLMIVASALVHPLGTSLATITFVQAVSYVAPALWLARRRGSWRRVLALEPVSARCAAGAAAAGVGVATLNVFLVLPIALRFAPEPPASLEALAAGPLWMVLLGLAVVPALCEELFFRGAVCRALEPRLGRVAAATLAAGVFSLSHLSLARAAPTFVLGVFAGLALFAGHSTAAAMVLHFAHNSAILVADRFLDEGIITNDYLWVVIVGGLAASVGGALVMRGSPGASDLSP